MAGIHGISASITEVTYDEVKIPTTNIYSFRAYSNNRELKEKVIEFIRWAREKGYLEFSRHPEAYEPSPIEKTYMVKEKGTRAINIHVDPLEEGDEKSLENHEEIPVVVRTGKRGRPKGSTNKVQKSAPSVSGTGKRGRPKKNPGEKKVYIPTGRPRGRPRKNI
jgi:hypothetical protein